MDCGKSAGGHSAKRVLLRRLLLLRLAGLRRLLLSCLLSRFTAECGAIIGGVDIEVQFFDKVFHGSQTTCRMVHFVVAVSARTGCGEKRIHAILVRKRWIRTA